MFPFIVIGLFTGAVYALAAMGLVLTYKTAGIFNFSFGATAMFCAYTFSQLRDILHVSQWYSLPIVLIGVAPLIGVLMERLFRPLTAAPAEIQIVVTLGVLAFFLALVPIIYTGEARGLRSIFPTSTFKVGSNLHVGYDDLATLLLTVGLAAGLWLLLRRTKFGMATRAVVDNRDLSALAGVKSETVSRAAWVISCVFAALVGILLSSYENLDRYSLVLLVIYAFAPAVLAKLVSLPLAFLGGMVMGVVLSILTKYDSNATVADIRLAFPYAALFVLLVAYGRRLKEVRSSFRPLRSPPPRPIGGSSVVAGLVLLVAALVLPSLISGPQLSDVTLGVIFAAIGLTLVVLTGWAGQISLAQFSFVGIGAFTVGHLGTHGSDFFPAALLGALIAIPVGLLVGLPSLRLSGLYLALATMAFALLMDTLVFNRPDVGGGSTGMAIHRPRLGPWNFASTTSFYYLCIGVLAVYVIGASVLRRGPIGRRLQMINDSPLAASTFGVSLTLTKLITFAACGAAAAFAGALFGAGRQFISPNDVSFNASLELLLLVVLGGRSLVGGALVAGTVFGLQLFPIPPSVEQYIPLGVALGVIGVANNPEGPIAMTVRIVRYLSAVLTRAPRPGETELRPEPKPSAPPRSAHDQQSAPSPAGVHV